MPAPMIADERTRVRLSGSPVSARTLHGVLKELDAAKKFVTSVNLLAINRLSADDRYELGLAEGLIAGAIAKIEAAGVAS